MTMVNPYRVAPSPPLDSPYYNIPTSRRSSRTNSLSTAALEPASSEASRPALPAYRAQALVRHNSYPTQGSAAGIGRGEQQAENLLRRKTPSGILHASYDGTSVADENEKPHVSKHMLLPRTESGRYPYTLTKALPLRSHQPSLPATGLEQPLPHIDTLPQPQKSLLTGTGEFLQGFQGVYPRYQPQQWSASRYFETGSGLPSDVPQSRNQGLPKMDSVLSQIAPLQPLQPNYSLQPYPYPLMQSPLHTYGPTASNDQGPFGPYRGADGTFMTYQSAPLRNLPYPHMTLAWNSGRTLQTWTMQDDATAHNLQHDLISPLQSNNSYLHATQPLHPYSLPSISSHRRSYSKSRDNTAYKPELSRALTWDSAGLSLGQVTPGSFNASPSTPLAGIGPPPNNVRTKEEVFVWAHRVYVDFLKYLQSTRKPNPRQPNGLPMNRPHIYPRPPKQPNTASSENRAEAPGNRSRKPSYQGPIQTSLWAAQSGRLSDFQSLSQASTVPNADSLPGNNSAYSTEWPAHDTNQFANASQPSAFQPPHLLRRMSGISVAGYTDTFRQGVTPSLTAAEALQAITHRCQGSDWNWVDGILLGGCLAYALGDYEKAKSFFERVLVLDDNHVEANANLATAMLALQQKAHAEVYWRKALNLRPSYFEAAEHLISLLHQTGRIKEAVELIEKIEAALRIPRTGNSVPPSTKDEDPSSSGGQDELPRFGADQPGFGSSGYAIPDSENGRMLALIHMKGNSLYSLQDNAAAAKAFESAVLIGTGPRFRTIHELIQHILCVVYDATGERNSDGSGLRPSNDPVLLHPQFALQTAKLCFRPNGELPGIKDLPSEGLAKKSAIATTSNSLLSLAKIFQDGMVASASKTPVFQVNYSVREILALYYLSLALQPSPSTANNVGILLASVQQAAPSRHPQYDTNAARIPGLVPGTGVALALAYYNYGLHLDARHAHLYTNLGSLLKDIGQLDAAITMYEQAVQCDNNFDIALANLANAVKDKNRIADAIKYYRRAVEVNPDFAEAVCGLANALNSVCDWKGRGGIADKLGKRDRWHVDEHNHLTDARDSSITSTGLVKRVVDLVDKQLTEGETWGRGTMDEAFVQSLVPAVVYGENDNPYSQEKARSMREAVEKWRGKRFEGARVIRLAERAMKRMTWHWYNDRRNGKEREASFYKRPHLPTTLPVPAAPTVLPFHTFTTPMSALQIRQISQRNGLRISCSTLRSSWLPSHVYPPPPPPRPHLNVGYVSSDFNNHPLAHLMQSVFGLHNPARVKAFCYATTVSDGSIYRQQIEREAPVFYDASSWTHERLVNQIVQDGIHILINLNGYTRGARNEVFAARPAPIQMSFMGFAGTLGAEWCDYLLADSTSIPEGTLRPWRRNVDMEDLVADEGFDGQDENWIYGENIIFCRDTFFCCDHRQSAPDAKGLRLSWEEEQRNRWAMRKEIFPDLPDNFIIFGNFNQLYKIEPTTFRTWLRILAAVPHAILWLLRFPDVGETFLRRTAVEWAGQDVANRLFFTDVAAKPLHISRARVCDLFLDTPECNAHTTAADILWSGTPLLTLPRYEYKMCSRMASSILKGALPRNEVGKQAASELIAVDEEDYEKKAIRLGRGCSYQGHRAQGRLAELRRILVEGRWESGLFDTGRWVRDLEEAYEIAWRKWERGEGGDIYLQPQRDF